jgi:hypothetical protein
MSGHSHYDIIMIMISCNHNMLLWGHDQYHGTHNNWRDDVQVMIHHHCHCMTI